MFAICLTYIFRLDCTIVKQRMRQATQEGMSDREDSWRRWQKLDAGASVTTAMNETII